MVNEHGEIVKDLGKELLKQALPQFTGNKFDLVRDATVPGKIGILRGCGIFHLAVTLHVFKARDECFLPCAYLF